jgi:signal transduction histidine kinase
MSGNGALQAAGDDEPRPGELRVRCAGFGAELPPQLGRALARAAAALGASERLGPDAPWARGEVDRSRRADALAVVVAGPLIGNAELVRLAQSLGGRRGLAPVVAVRDRCPAEEAGLLLANGCCDVLEGTLAAPAALLSALRLAFEVSRRQRAEAPWLESEETTAAWPPPALVEVRRLAALGRGFAALTHDLKNLLQPILGYADLVVSAEEPRAAAQAAAQLGELAGEAERLLRRSLVRMQGGALAAAAERECDALLRGCERLLLAILGPRVRLRLEPRAAGSRVAVPEGALDQILMNLAANARDAMPSGGVLEVRSRAEPGAWVVEVEDSGTGIAAERLERLFEPGFIGGDAGAGLGLWIVRGLVDELGGAIGVTSRVDRGTRVAVRLPASEPAGAEPYQPSR